MNYFKLFILLFLLNTSLLSDIQLTSKEKEFIKNHPTITLGTEGAWAPYVIKNNDGTISGYDNNILTLINKATGANFILKIGDWVEVQKFAKEKKLDGLSTVIVTDKRKEFLNFSNIYISLKKMVMVKDRNPLNIKSAEDLVGKTIVLFKGNKFDQNAAKQFKGVKIIYADTLLGTTQEVIYGEADATIGSGVVGYMLSKEGLPYMENAFAIDHSLDLRFAVRKDWSEAISILNKGLSTISSHERTHLKQKWFLIKKEKDNRNLKLTQKEKIYLKEKKEITMCIDPNWMPFEKIDKNGNHIGMSADYFKIFQNNTNIKMKLIPTKTWDETLKFAKQRKCDIISLSMETSERKEYLNFTTPYLKMPLVIATKQDVTFIDTMDSIKNKKVGIPKGYAFVEILKKKYKNLNIVEVKNIEEGLNKVNTGELFGYIGTLASIGYRFQTGYSGELKIAGKFEEKWELGIGVRNDDKQLFSILQKAVDNLDNKQQQKILNDWISIKYEKGIDYTLVWQILIIVFIIILFFIYRQYILSKQNNLLNILASTDPMTKLYNRRHFIETAETLLDLAKRNKTDSSIIMLDIDKFKNVNDTYGHKVGDDVITSLADILQKYTRKSDIVSRWGGEEFVILLPNTTSDGALVIAEKIRQVTQNLIIKLDNKEELKFTISLGISQVVNNQDVNIEPSISRADVALYEAKESGRNKICINHNHEN